MPDVRGRSSKPFGELKPYTPSLLDQLVAKAGRLFGDTRGSHATAQALLGSSSQSAPNLGLGLLDAVPGVGMALRAQEAAQQGGSAQDVAIAAMPIPGAGRGLRVSQRLMRRIPKMAEGALVKHDAENAIISATRSNQPVISQAASGAAPDRSGYTLVRHRAKQGDSARFSALEKRLDTNPEAKAEVMNLAKDGEDIGRNWYNTEALRDRFIGELGHKDGDAAWREYMWMVGATSTGAKVPANIRMASHYFVKNQEGRQGLANMAEDLLQGGYVPPKGSGYGHKMQKNQAKNVGNVVTGGWSPDAPATLNPKPRGFLQSLLGNETNIAADKHFMRLMGMMSDDPQFLHTSAEVSQDLVKKLRGQFGEKFTDKYVKVAPLEGGNVRINFNAKRAVKDNKDVYGFIKKDASVWDDMPNDNEYAAFERVTNKMAKELNMTGPQFQASLWMGAAKKTGVDPSSLDTFVNLFDKRVKTAAAERGRTPQDVFSRFARRVEPLAVPGLLGAGAATGGLLNQSQPQQGGLLQSPGP